MANEHHNKSVGELRKDVVEMQEKLRTIRFGGAGSRSRDVKESRNLRREVARMLTELRAKEIAAQKDIASAAKTA